MSPYKRFIASAKEYLESVPALKFLLSIHMVVFAVGGAFFLLGVFIFGISDTFTTLGTVLMLAGLILTIIQEDMTTLVIASAAIALGSLVAWLVRLFAWGSLYGLGAALMGDHAFNVAAFFYFLAFGAIAVFVFVKSEKFREMRAASARPAGVSCPRCAGFIPAAAAFCPQCAAPNPGPPQYAPPAAPQYAPPAAPQYAPPAAPQYAPPVAPQYAPPAAPQPEPAAEAVHVAEAEPVAEPAAANSCKSCGAELPAGAVFCGKCGAHQ